LNLRDEITIDEAGAYRTRHEVTVIIDREFGLVKFSSDDGHDITIHLLDAYKVADLLRPSKG
jgi:hypothetical protein